VNNYNAPVMLAWQADMDLRFVLNAYACVMYVASYIMRLIELGVRYCNKGKYTKATIEVLEKVFAKEFEYVCAEGRLGVCSTCDGALKRGNIPVQA